MRLNNLLNTTCTVYRLSETLDAYGSPTGHTETRVAEYPCRVSRKTLTASQAEPATKTAETWTLYLEATADIELGDLVLVGGAKYRAGIPYSPGGHHIEIPIEKGGEA